MDTDVYAKHLENVEFIRKHLDKTARALSVVEECCELGQVAAKLPRACGATFNPTPVREFQIEPMMKEEITDLLNALWVLGYDPMTVAYLVMSGENTKLQRWADRIEAELEKKHETKNP